MFGLSLDLQKRVLVGYRHLSEMASQSLGPRSEAPMVILHTDFLIVREIATSCNHYDE